MRDADFFSPSTSWLIGTSAVQRFVPFNHSLPFVLPSLHSSDPHGLPAFRLRLPSVRTPTLTFQFLPSSHRLYLSDSPIGRAFSISHSLPLSVPCKFVADCHTCSGLFRCVMR